MELNFLNDFGSTGLIFFGRFYPEHYETTDEIVIHTLWISVTGMPHFEPDLYICVLYSIRYLLYYREIQYIGKIY